jgi:hypothetical protein
MDTTALANRGAPLTVDALLDRRRWPALAAIALAPRKRR